MSRYNVILWDIDGTLLDFLAAEKAAMRACFEKFHMGECTDEMIARYSAINKKYWEALERGEITKQQVLIGRYEEFFTLEGLDTSIAQAFNEEYQIRLGDTCVFFDNGYDLVKQLKHVVKQYAVTNGTSRAQSRKLKKSGLGELFDGVFISDRIGHEKPTIEFFEKVFEELADVDKKDMLIVGDSLTSDIRGGNNAGIATCWYNPFGKENNQDVQVDYEISNLWEVEALIAGQ